MGPSPGAVAAREPVRLFERDAVATELGALADGAARGRGALVMIGGEAGVGKTSLVARVCGEAPIRVAFGACDPLRTPRPLGPVLDLARALGGPVARWDEEPTVRERLFSDVLGELSGRQPTVVVVEDVHWADEATLDFLRFLGRRIGGTRALALVTYRTDDVRGQRPVALLLGDLATSATLRRVKLQPLSVAAVGELADGRGPDALELHRVTGGNPFFVTEVLAAGPGPVPASVRDAVLARAGRLSPGALEVLWTVAVVPQRVEGWLLEQVCGDVGSLDECVAAGLLCREGESLAFRHQLAREALEADVPADRRRALHGRVLAALKSAPGTREDVARLAYHAEAAGNAESVRRYARRAAAQAALVGAHREAAAQYARVLRFGDHLQTLERLDVLERYSFECYFTGQMRDALCAREAVLAGWRHSQDRGREGASLTWIARLAWFTGDRERAERASAQAIELLEPLGPSSELAMAYGQRAGLYMVAQDVAGAVAWGEKAIALARALGDLDNLSQALNDVGTAKLSVGQPRGRELLHESLELAMRGDMADHVARAWINLACTDIRSRNYSLGLEELEQGINFCLEHELGPQRLFLLAWSAQAALDLGAWNEAGDRAGEVLEHPGALSITRVTALTVLGRLRARRGDPDPWSPLEEAAALAGPAGDLRRLVPVATARAEIAWLTSTGEVMRETDRVWAAACGRGTAWDIGELAFWRWRAGALEELPDGAHATPYGLQIAGDPRGAGDAWARHGCPYERAIALLDSERMDDIREALAEAERLGARPATVIAARRLRELGALRVPRGPRPATRDNPARLTARQLEVLTLMEEGLRNAQIAQRLVISERTVDHHVSAILRKLEAPSRREACAAAARLGLTARPHAPAAQDRQRPLPN